MGNKEIKQNLIPMRRVGAEPSRITSGSNPRNDGKFPEKNIFHISDEFFLWEMNFFSFFFSHHVLIFLVEPYVGSSSTVDSVRFAKVFSRTLFSLSLWDSPCQSNASSVTICWKKIRSKKKAKLFRASSISIFAQYCSPKIYRRERVEAKVYIFSTSVFSCFRTGS